MAASRDGRIRMTVLGGYLGVGVPEPCAHDRLDDLDALAEMLQCLGLVCCAPDVRVGGVGLLGAVPVRQAVADQPLRHFLAAAELADEVRVQPWLVDPQRRVGQQAVPVEALDVVALEGGAVAPDVDVVFLHGDDQHGAGDCAADGGGVEVVDSGSGDMEGAGLEGGDAFGDELLAAIDQGTTSTRCMLFDPRGGGGEGGNPCVAAAQAEHRQIFPRPGWVEHDPAEMWRRTREVMRDAMAAAPAAKATATAPATAVVALRMFERAETR